MAEIGAIDPVLRLQVEHPHAGFELARDRQGLVGRAESLGGVGIRVVRARPCDLVHCAAAQRLVAVAGSTAIAGNKEKEGSHESEQITNEHPIRQAMRI